ncbi:MAG TPA: HepT-like ribonuclease domain-containing protein [Phycisphaerae bacterium]|nr:HepT-like ribonuclease domain-containing protein [Phycisphaerae bacterium]
MPSEGRDAAYLSDMLSAAEAVQRFVNNRTFNDLLTDDFLQAAVERKIEIIGEAARRVSESCQAAHPEIEWRKIIATRHIFAHDYGELDYEVVWRIATIHVPLLVEQLRRLSLQDDQ